MSLRTRLLGAVAAVALVALVVASITTYSMLRAYLYRQVDAALETARLPLSLALDSGQAVGIGMVEHFAPGMFVEVRSADGTVLGAIDARSPGGEAYTPALPRRIRLPDTGADPDGPARFFTTSAVQEGGPAFRVQVSPLVGGAQLVLAAPLGAVTATLTRLLSAEAFVVAVALVAAILLGWWLVALGLKPLDQMEQTTRAIAAGEWSRRVPDPGAHTELGHLARSFNTMLDRIQEAFARRDETEAELRRSEERLRQFIADASHELRTPVAAVSAYAELFERGADRRPEDLARVLKGIRAETARMARLVQDLLLLAHLDEGRPLEKAPVELVSLAAEAVQAARAVGPAWPVELSARRPVEISGDETRLRQVLDNLLANVRAHTPEGTRTWLRVGEEDGWAVLEVADDGPGLTPEQAAHVFERFYRADVSRSRQHGGTGLGLAIVAAIVAAHGGTVEATRSREGGALFRVRLPRISPEREDLPPDQLA